MTEDGVFVVPASAPTLKIALSYTDPAGSVSASPQLVNDLDIAIKNPAGVWTNLSDDLNNLRSLTFANPAQGSWEVHILGSTVSIGPQFFAVAMNAEYYLANLTLDVDGDGTEDSSDDCAFTAGTSTIDRQGCVDTDGDGYSDPNMQLECCERSRCFHQRNHTMEQTKMVMDTETILRGLNPDSGLSRSGWNFIQATAIGCPVDPDIGYVLELPAWDGRQLERSGCSVSKSCYGPSSGDRNRVP